MNPRTLLILLGVTAAFVVAAAILMRGDGGPAPSTAPDAAATSQGPAFPGLREKIDSIDRVEVASADEQFALVRDDAGWKVEGGFWAQEENTTKLIGLVAALDRSEPRTASAELHDRLGLNDPAAEGARGVLVTLKAGGEQQAQVIIGNPVTSASGDRTRSGVYFRLPDEDQTWAALGIPSTVNRRKVEFEDRALVDIQPADVASVEMTLATGEVNRVERDAEDKLVLANVPEDKELVNPREPDSIAGFLQALRYNAVVEEGALEKELADPSTARFAMKDGRVVTASISVEAGEENAENFWGTFAVEFDESLRAEGIEGSVDETRADAEKLNARLAGHVFQLPSWKVRMVRKPADEMLREAQKRVTASHILVAYEGSDRSSVTGRTREEAQARAEEALAKVQADPDAFAALVAEYSDEPGAAERGGDLGEFIFDAMTPPFSEAAFALEPGEISGVVETDFGFHIIKRTK